MHPASECKELAKQGIEPSAATAADSQTRPNICSDKAAGKELALDVREEAREGTEAGCRLGIVKERER